MALWRVQALKLLPELRRDIDSADSVMALWIEIWIAFESAYEASPRNESLIERVYRYADWCSQAKRGPDAAHDPSTAIAVCFYEHLPNFTPSREDMPRWVSFSDVAQSKEIFSYLIGEQEYGKLLEFMAKHRSRYRPRKGIPGAERPSNKKR